MALRNVVKLGDEILRKKSREVTDINDKVADLLDDMRDTMTASEGCGLAAPQVGVLKRICIIRPEADGEITELINPVITEKEGEQEGYEACLSVPGLAGKVVRPMTMKVEALDREGNKHSYTFSEFEAVVASHEIDHLDGTVYVDKATDIHDPEERMED